MANQVNAQEQSVQQNVQKGGANNKKLIIIISAIVVALLIIIVAIMMLFPSPKSVVSKFASGYKSMNSTKVLSTLHPKIKSEDADEIKDMFKDMKSEKLKIKKIVVDNDYEKIDDDELEYLTEYLERQYDIDEKSIKEVRKYDLEMTYSEDGEQDETEWSVYVVKIGMKWYVIR